MKLIFAVVQGTDAERLLEALTSNGFRATQISSAGGFLRESNVTLLIGVEDEQVPAVRQLINENAHSRRRFVNPLMPIAGAGDVYAGNPLEVTVGGANVFVVPVSRYERLGV
jgi:uncharacterized protein YaaQ